MKIISSLCLSLVVALSFSAVTLTTVAYADDPLNEAIRTIEKTNPVKGEDAEAEVQGTVQTVVQILAYVAGIIAVIVIIVQGIRFITAGGNAQTAGEATKGIIYALIGLVIIISAYQIVSFVLKRLAEP